MLSALRSYKNLLAKNISFHRWLLAQSKKQSNIDKTLDLCGLSMPYKYIEIGSNCSIGRDVSIYFPSEAEGHGDLSIKDSCFIGRNTLLGLFASITVGKDTMIAPYCFLITGSHSFDRRDAPIRTQGHNVASIHIGEDVWIGTHVTILPGVTIGKGAIVAAGAVVNKNIPPYEIWGGVPAKFLKERP